MPAYAYAGFPEGEKGYDLNKIEESYKLQCGEIGNDQCLAKAVAMGGCIYSFEINKGKGNENALRNGNKGKKTWDFLLILILSIIYICANKFKKAESKLLFITTCQGRNIFLLQFWRILLELYYIDFE